MNDDQDRSDLGSRVPLPRGTRIDTFTIELVLGAGGFGITYLAEHARLGKKYAIKEYFPEAFGQREGSHVRATGSNGTVYRRGLDSFINEARALAQFKHPSILDVVGIAEENGTAYIIFAFEKGRSMKAWLRELGRKPTQLELDQLLAPLLDALVEVHGRNLLHRDIAPDNILIRDEGTPVLIDFGAAREAVRERPNVMSAIIKHGYSPPEQYSTRPGLQGPWTDVYGLAATLHEAITGVKPPDAMTRLLDDTLGSLADSTNAEYREDFLAAVDAGLRLRPEDRPQAISVWREQLLRGAETRLATFERRIRHKGIRPKNAARQSATSAAAAEQEQDRSETRMLETSRPPDRRKDSRRPDLSALEDAQVGDSPEQEAPSASAQKLVRVLWVLFVSTLGGAAAGWLLSILLASIIAASCTGDSCVSAYLWPCTLIGGAAGLVVGFHILRSSADAGDPPVN